MLTVRSFYILIACFLTASIIIVPGAESSDLGREAETGIVTSIPRTMNYQGILKDSAGDPVTDSIYSVTFRIFNTESGGSSLWDETLPCTSSAGYFNAIFSNVDLPFDEDYWLELEVDFEVLTPRQKIGMAGYSARSDTSDHAIAGGGWVDDGFNVRLEASYDKVGIGTSSPSNKLHVVGSESVPILNVEQNGSFRATRFYCQNACALWVERAGNHGLRVSQAFGDGILIEYAGLDGIRVDSANGWAGYFNGNGYFKGNLGIGTTSPSEQLTVDGNILISGKATIGPGHTNNGIDAFVAGANNTANGNYSVVGGGQANTANGPVGTIGGGDGNYANDWGTIGGGGSNTAGSGATVGGGTNNNAGGGVSTIAGGQQNTASNVYATVSGGHADTASGEYSVISGGRLNNAQGNYSSIGGGYNNIAGGTSYSTVSGGWNNVAGDISSTVSGGSQNTAGGPASTIGGGDGNYANDWGTVGGGGSNIAGDGSAIGGGSTNNAGGDGCVIGGGIYNNATGTSCAVGGGDNNDAPGNYCTISGGRNNNANNDYGTISGGWSNTVNGTYSYIGGGWGNTAEGSATIAGGTFNQTSTEGFIGGGSDNFISGSSGVISGGTNNSITGDHGVVGGGRENAIPGNFNGVLSGYRNTAGGNTSDSASFIGGGRDNEVRARYTSIIGGRDNFNNAHYSLIAGGQSDTLQSSADYSFVFGNGVYINNSYNVALYDGTNPGRLGLNRDDWQGGIDYPLHVGTDASNGNGAHLTEGGIWVGSSSHTFKENFHDLDSQQLLRAISALSIGSWNFKNSDEKHIGPVAEDFVAAFDVGTVRESDGRRENRYLASGDIAGVALAGVKELIQENQNLRDLISQLERRIAELERGNK